jgi:PAS domain S-box-containing protein
MSPMPRSISARSLLRSKPVRDWPSGTVLASVCIAGLIGILVFDFRTTPSMTLGGLTFIFLVIGALWLSARLTWIVITAAVLARLAAIAAGGVAVWTGTGQILGSLLVGGAVYLAARALRVAKTERATVANQRSAVAKELRTSEERFHALVDGVQDYAIFWLDPAGHVTSWNQGAERIKGYRANEIIGRHFSIFYPAEDVAAGKPAQELRVVEQEGRFEEEGWRLRKDGSGFWASVLITALHDDAGRLRGFAKVTRDITERKRMQDLLLESERREARKFHELADRMAALEQMKSRFMNLASHELRTPMSLIRGYVSMFESGDLGTLNENGKRAVSVLSARTQDINLLIEQMLEAARLEEGSLTLQQESLDLREVVIKAVDLFRRSLGADHRLSVRTPDDVVPVIADRRRLGAIVQNLLDNAIKYSPAPGEVLCELLTVPGWAEVKVHDSGLGLSAEQLDQVFRPFGRVVTAETAHIGGTDLGLYLSRELTRLQGGDITVESERGAGSTFTVRLPMALVGQLEQTASGVVRTSICSEILQGARDEGELKS